MSGGLSPRARRLLDETAHDWRHEVADAATPFMRLVAYARGSAGMLRAAVAVSPEWLSVPCSPRWMLSLLFAVIVVVPMDAQRLASRVPSESGVLVLISMLWPALVSVLGYVFGLALLTGPGRGPSPLPAFVIVLVTNLTAFYLLWPRLAWAVWLQRGGSPARTFDFFPVSQVLFVLGYSMLAMLIAERVRIDRRRVVSTVQFAGLIALLMALLWINSTIAKGMGLPYTHPAFTAGPMALALVLPGAFWVSLRRRQQKERVHAGA